MTNISERPAASTVSHTAWLVTHGRQPWAEIHALLRGCTCAWADIDGFHAEAAPTDPPLATHLWAWAPNRLLRVRIDGGEGVTAELHLTETAHGEPVPVTEREASSWPRGEGRVSVEKVWRDRPLRVYQVAGLMPLEFASLDGTDIAGQDATPASGLRHGS